MRPNTANKTPKRHCGSNFSCSFLGKATQSRATRWSSLAESWKGEKLLLRLVLSCWFSFSWWWQSWSSSLSWRPLMLSRGEEVSSAGLSGGKVAVSYQTGLLRWVRWHHYMLNMWNTAQKVVSIFNIITNIILFKIIEDLENTRRRRGVPGFKGGWRPCSCLADPSDHDHDDHDDAREGKGEQKFSNSWQSQDFLEGLL